MASKSRRVSPRRRSPPAAASGNGRASPACRRSSPTAHVDSLKQQPVPDATPIGLGEIMAFAHGVEDTSAAPHFYFSGTWTGLQVPPRQISIFSATKINHQEIFGSDRYGVSGDPEQFNAAWGYKNSSNSRLRTSRTKNLSRRSSRSSRSPAVQTSSFSRSATPGSLTGTIPTSAGERSADKAGEPSTRRDRAFSLLRPIPPPR